MHFWFYTVVFFPILASKIVGGKLLNSKLLLFDNVFEYKNKLLSWNTLFSFPGQQNSISKVSVFKETFFEVTDLWLLSSRQFVLVLLFFANHRLFFGFSSISSWQKSLLQLLLIWLSNTQTRLTQFQIFILLNTEEKHFFVL